MVIIEEEVDKKNSDSNFFANIYKIIPLNSILPIHCSNEILLFSQKK